MAIRVDSYSIHIDPDKPANASCWAHVYISGGRGTVRSGKEYLTQIDLRGVSLTKAVRFIRDAMKNGWQDLERTWMDVDLVYETRWDCPAAPERVRLAA